ncbi:Methyltransferase type 11 [Gloeothece citriformis PCC 7424]|uniref:Methyltransferase type 11 n=1 Tax=Gloeothece citriformis (strain PCC 7424) TaxID=65393 RepID=B7KJK2_GLOC7|nr:class I SAM-dependent methyltransferase [Gloeothece citriformis]ACK73679.1 Methyltransferase type 11 [Gloeothece citriformis PCC 7424]
MSDNFFERKANFFDRWAPNYDILFTTVFYQAIHKRMLEYVELRSAANVLDLGCGTGRLLHRLATQFPHLRGTGLDLSKEMLRQARQRNQYPKRLIYIQGNAESLPFAQGQFDAVFNTISFLHYPNPTQVLSEVKRVLNQGGRFYLADYSTTRKVKLPFVPGQLKFYPLQQREYLADQVGLKTLAHHYLLSNVFLTILRA